jgi:metallo-beta-lactamase family protein
LLAWAGAMQKKPLHTFVVHGEEDSAVAFGQALQTELGFTNVHIPDPEHSFTL